jgi:hypothetical protein
MSDNRKHNIARYGEVYTPDWLIEKMLHLVEGQTSRIDATFLEPACGDGRFLCSILEKKIEQCKRVFARESHKTLFFSFVSLTSMYGIDIQPKNVEITRQNLFSLFMKSIKKQDREWIGPAVHHVICKNVLLANTILAEENENKLLISQWSPLNTSHIQRRDFYFDSLFKAGKKKMPPVSMDKDRGMVIEPANKTFKSRRISDLVLDA